MRESGGRSETASFQKCWMAPVAAEVAAVISELSETSQPLGQIPGVWHQFSSVPCCQSFVGFSLRVVVTPPPEAVSLPTGPLDPLLFFHLYPGPLWQHTSPLP